MRYGKPSNAGRNYENTLSGAALALLTGNQTTTSTISVPIWFLLSPVG